MPYFFSPIGNSQIVDANGDPLVGGTIETYLAGTSTPATTYTDDTGGTAQGVVMTLNSLGRPTLGPVWILGGVPLKFIIKNALGVVQPPTFDDVSGIGDTSATPDQFPIIAGTPTYISATSFSLQGDQTNDAQINRRIRSINNGGTIYSTISNRVFAAGITTVTVVNDSGVLDVGLSQVNYSLLTPQNSSIPPASTTTTGGVELATTAEALTGTDTGRAVTPAGLAATRRVAQFVTFATGAVATASTVIPYDDTIPQITEGDQYMVLPPFTPINAASTLEIEVVLFGSHNAANSYLAACLFQDAIANALAAGSVFMATATAPAQITFKYVVSAASITARTYRVRAGGQAAGTFTFNGSAGARYYGGVMASSITIREYLP